MIDDYAIQIALLRPVHATKLAPVIMPNQSASPTGPYIVAQHVRSSTTGPAVSADITVVRGFVQFTVVVDEAQLEGPGLTIARSIARLFSQATRISADDAEITIMQPPHIETGYPSGGRWRIPVRVDYQAS